MTRPSLRAILCLCAGLHIAQPGSGQAEAPSLQGLITGLAQSETSAVRFSEERHLQFLTDPLTLKGTLTFSPPDRLERIVLKPKWERMVIEDGLMSVEANKRDRPMRLLLKDYPVLEALVSALRALFSGNAEALQEVFEVSLQTEESGWLLTLVPRSQVLRSAVAAIRVNGQDGKLKVITLEEAGGDISVVTIHGAA